MLAVFTQEFKLSNNVLCSCADLEKKYLVL